MMHIGGWAGRVSSVLAFYTGGAIVVNSISARSILPLGPTLPAAMDTSALMSASGMTLSGRPD